MATLNRKLLDAVKEGFVRMPAGGGVGPVAGGGLMTQAQAAPIGGPPPGDPFAGGGGGGLPPDPAMGGGLPPDPSMGGGLPPGDPGGLPPEAAGALPPEALAALMGGGAGGGSASITMTVDELIKLIEGVAGAVKGKPRNQAPGAELGGLPAGDPAAGGGGLPPM